MYYFPGPFTQNYVFDTKAVSLSTTVNSGKNALRLGLRSFNLPLGSKVGIPSFCCNEVVNAVLEEKLQPYFFDVKEVGSYWANYKESEIKNEDLKAIIIIHMYGYLHPDTQEIIKTCKLNGVNLIHDAAQSFGIDTTLFGKDLIVYSFGPGKSTTAARGGELINFHPKSSEQISKPGFWDNMEAGMFYNSRLFGNKMNRLGIYKWNLSKRLASDGKKLLDMGVFQKQKALEAKTIALTKDNGRKERYLMLKEAVLGLDNVKVAYENEEGLFFKMVLYVNKNIDNFISYLRSNNIPYCLLADNMDLSKRELKGSVFFTETYLNIVEISTERSISLSEMNRVAKVLMNYKNGN